MATDLSRRDFTAAAVLGSAALIGPRGFAAALGGNNPFALGVASGEPVPDGFVLWTRLAPEPLEGDGGMPPHPVAVRWEVSSDEHFRTVRHGTVVADPQWGHSAHVEVTGLASDRPYFYRFIVGGIVSPVGRTRTAPARGALVDRLRIAFTACQHYEAGHYAGYHHMVEEHPDLIVFLGDYIYEGAPGDKGVRHHLNPEPVDLPGYRVRYATYKSDPLLQAAHRAAPWISTWDDHEVQDNYAGTHDKHNGDVAAFLRRRAAAYRAYYEHMPLRSAARPVGPNMRLYRTVDWGALVQFQVIDDRQYRDPPPCQQPDAIARHLDMIGLRPDCPERLLAARTMLGRAQEAWLHDQLRRTRSRWNLLTQQTLMKSTLRIPPNHPEAGPSVYNTDAWDGFPATRDRIARRWREAKTPNPIVIGGDIHAFIVGDQFDPDDERHVIASEFVGGSMTSTAGDPMLKASSAANPGFKFAENKVRGYTCFDITPDRCEARLRSTTDARDPQSSISTLAKFTIENGRAGLQSA